jgi:hypothetical protein
MPLAAKGRLECFCHVLRDLLLHFIHMRIDQLAILPFQILSADLSTTPKTCMNSGIGVRFKIRAGACRTAERHAARVYLRIDLHRRPPATDSNRISL